MFAITYLSPSRLWLFAVVIGLVAAYVLLQTRRNTYAVKFTNLALLGSVAPRRPGWRRHLPAIAMLVGMSFVVIALARPAREEKVPRERATVIVVLDVSLSMDATDVPPSRLRAAKQAAKTFLEIIPSKINVGLVSFNKLAQILVTPTTDRAAVANAIDNLQLGEGTAIGEGIFASLQAIAQAPQPLDGSDEAVPARIVLLSDGQTTVGRPDSIASREAKRAEVPVSTIAFGTQDGFIQDPRGNQLVPVPVDVEALEDIAEETDGTAFTAATEEELKAVYEDIGSSVGYVEEFREIGLWFTGMAMLSLVMSSLMSLAWFSRLP